MEYITVKELFKITKGKKVEEIDYKNENSIRYIQIDDLRNNNNIKHCENINKYVIAKKEDIIIAWDGANAGTIGFGIEGAIGSTLAILRKENKEMDTEFCGLFLRSKSAYLREKCTGATIPHIQRRALEDIKIPKISLNKQIEIKNIINKAQELIDKRKEQIQDLDELVKSQFIEMFSEVNEYVRVSEYIESLTAGKSLAGESECKNKVLNTGSISYDYFDMNQVKNLPNDYIPKEEHLVNVGDVLISRMNTSELVGATAYVWNVNPNTYIPDRLWKANFKPNCNPIFVWQLLIQNSTKEKIRRIASGTSGSMKNISKLGLLGIEVIKVDIEKQNEFANFVKQVDKLKFEMEKSLKELEDNFNALMQKAFNGELFN